MPDDVNQPSSCEMDKQVFIQSVKNLLPNSINAEARTIEVIFTSGDLCQHGILYKGQWKYVPTRIKISKQCLQLDKFKGSPVLDAHNSYSARLVIGVVEKAWIDNGFGKALLRFSNSEPAQEVWNLIQEGVLRECSLGFCVKKIKPQIEKNQDGDEKEVFLITEIDPLEISMVPVGADRGAKVQSHQPPFKNQSLKEKADMPNQSTPTVAGDSTPVEQAKDLAPKLEQSGLTPQVSHLGTDTNSSIEQARKDERARITEIQQAAEQLGCENAVVQKAVLDGTSADAFRALAIKAFAKQGQEATSGIGANPRPVTITGDAQERFCQGATLGLMERGGLSGGEQNEFTGMTLTDLARQSLELVGQKSSGERMDMVGRAFTQAGAHGTSDFGSILSNVAGKAALKGWEESQETFTKWTRAGVLTDFKKTPRVVLATYGRIFNITRQTVFNDDLSTLISIPRKLGMAANRTIGNLVYGVLTGNPKLADKKALFSKDHSNIADPASGLDIASLSAARQAMRLQKEGKGETAGPSLNIVPKYLIVPASLEATAEQLMKSKVDPRENRGHAPNVVAGMAEVIVDPRLDAHSPTAWFLAADGNSFDTIEVAYLDGISAPHIEQSDGWKTDGTELKVRIDAGVAPLDFRTMYMNPGA